MASPIADLGCQSWVSCRLSVTLAEKEALSGFWSGHRVEHISNGLPLNVYCPIDRNVARQALGIGTNGPVVMVVAHDLAERRKGSALLGEVLRQIRRRPLTVVTLGNGHISVSTQEISVCELGYVDHERTKALAYSAADMLLHPALVDNLPNVVVEAISCGTPCAAFRLGGSRTSCETEYLVGWRPRLLLSRWQVPSIRGWSALPRERTCA